MITVALSIVFGIAVPLSLIVIGGRYTYLTGNFTKGFFFAWSLVAAYYWLTFFLPLIIFISALHWEQAYDFAATILPNSGPGVFAMTVLGCVPSAISAGIALSFRALLRK